jgi:hypothetical protein
MAIEPLKIPIRTYGEPIPVAPDTNAEVEKINELVAAVNAGLATSNAIVGGDKFVQYLSSGTYGVPAESSTLDRLDPATILPGVEATVINPAPTPLTASAPSKSYVATIVPDGTAAGAFQVPAYTGATDQVWVVWQEVVDNSSFTPLLASELNPGKSAYAGLALRPLLIALVNGIGTGTTTITTQQPATQPATGPTVTGFLPSSAAVGASVTVTGTGFTKATAVLFNGTPASFQVINATTLVAMVPVDATTGPVAVTNSAGTGTSAANFTVVASTTTPPVTTNTPPIVSANAQVTGTSVKLTGLAQDADGVDSIFIKVFDSTGAVVQTFGPSVPGDTQYVSTWPSASPGIYSARAIATDSKGLAATSDAVSFTIAAAAITPDAPTVSYNSSTRKLIATDKVSPAGTLLFSYQGSAFVEYLGAIQVDDLAHDPQEWAFKRAASTGYLESPVAYSPAIAAKQATTNPTTLLVTSTNQSYNSRNEANNGGTRYDANTVFTFQTDCPNPVVNVYAYAGPDFQSAPGFFWVNGVEAGPFGVNIPTNATGPLSYTLTLPGTGLRTVQLYSAGQGNTASNSAFTSYVSLVSVVVPAGYSAQVVPVTKHLDEFIFVFGDSTTQAAGHGDGSFSWPRILNRDYRPNSDVYSAGHSSMVGGKFIDTPAHRAAQLAEYKAARAGYKKGIFWFDALVNDCYYNFATPAQLNSYYQAFAQLFLADAELTNDVLYFKSAIPTTSHNNGGANDLGYPLFAYRDAMSNAVSSIANVRVKYADGTQLQSAQYLVDGTHVSKDGDLHIASTINDLLNATTSTTTGLSKINAEQFGVTINLSTDSLQAVEYNMDGGNTWQSGSTFPTPSPGNHVFNARLVSDTTKVVTTTLAVNKVLHFDSPELKTFGTGWQHAAGDLSVGFTNTDGDYYTITDFMLGFIVYNSRQENCPELVSTVDASAPVTTNISGPGYDYTQRRVYTSPPLASGNHTVRFDSGAGSTINVYAIELIGNVTPTATPASGAALVVNTPLSAARQNFTVPGLSTTTAVTLCLVAQKPVNSTALYFLAGFPDGQGNLTDLVYYGSSSGSHGLGLNTYTSAYTTANDNTLLDNARTVLVTAKFYPGHPESFALWVNGVAQPLTTGGGAHAARAFTNTFTLGGDTDPNNPAGTWPGTVAGRLYLADLSDADRQQTEAYLRTQYAIS